ncbi:MAG: hypothetical protein WDN45_18010 [Caulobacteraceae bacterium]
MRYTENGQALALNDGFWNTASGRGKYSHYFLDPRTDQAGFMGVVTENRRQRDHGHAHRAARQADLRDRDRHGPLRPRHRRSRRRGRRQEPGGDGQAGRHLVQGHPGGGARQPRGRDPRLQHVFLEPCRTTTAQADYSFFADDCYRLENGSPTTSGPHTPPRQPPAAGAPPRRGPDMLSLGCKQGFETGFFRIVTRIRDRRFPLVDEDKGVAFAFGLLRPRRQRARLQAVGRRRLAGRPSRPPSPGRSPRPSASRRARSRRWRRC